MAAQNNAIRANYIKAKIDNMQQNTKCRLCSENETINHNMKECIKLVQKEYKIRRDWVGKVVHWELGKKMEFYHTANETRFTYFQNIVVTVWMWKIKFLSFSQGTSWLGRQV